MKKQTKIGLIALGLLVVMGLSAFTLANQVSAKGGPEQNQARPGIDRGDHMQALADELGISLEDLQAAYTSAQTALIKDKVDAGDLSQDQADEILEDLDDAGRPFRMGRGMGPMGSETFDTYLAEALEISVDELAQAKDNVLQAEIAQAVVDGKITQEQADLMIARRSVQGYMADAWTTAYQNALAQAVVDGNITQAQADLLLANIGTGLGTGFGGGMGFGGGRCGGKR